MNYKFFYSVFRKLRILPAVLFTHKKTRGETIINTLSTDTRRLKLVGQKLLKNCLVFSLHFIILISDKFTAVTLISEIYVYTNSVNNGDMERNKIKPLIHEVRPGKLTH